MTILESHSILNDQISLEALLNLMMCSLFQLEQTREIRIHRIVTEDGNTDFSVIAGEDFGNLVYSPSTKRVLVCEQAMMIKMNNFLNKSIEKQSERIKAIQDEHSGSPF